MDRSERKHWCFTINNPKYIPWENDTTILDDPPCASTCSGGSYDNNSESPKEETLYPNDVTQTSWVTTNVENINFEEVTYMVWQYELGDELTLHIQGYVEF